MKIKFNSAEEYRKGLEIILSSQGRQVALESDLDISRLLEVGIKSGLNPKLSIEIELKFETECVKKSGKVFDTTAFEEILQMSKPAPTLSQELPKGDPVIEHVKEILLKTHEEFDSPSIFTREYFDISDTDFYAMIMDGGHRHCVAITESVDGHAIHSFYEYEEFEASTLEPGFTVDEFLRWWISECPT